MPSPELPPLLDNTSKEEQLEARQATKDAARTKHKSWPISCLGALSVMVGSMGISVGILLLIAVPRFDLHLPKALGPICLCVGVIFATVGVVCICKTLARRSRLTKEQRR